MSPSFDRETVVNVAIVVVLLVLVSPVVAYAVPQTIGASESYVVLSGSMEPALQTGGVIYVYERSPEKIEEGDIITFNVEGARTDVTTHRVVDTVQRDGTRMFVTKGDANEDRDPVPVPPDAVIGVVPEQFGILAHVPFVGHLLLFAQSQQGIILLVFVPAGLLVVTELWSLYKEATSGGEEDESDSEDADPDPATTTDGGTERERDEPPDDDGAPEPAAGTGEVDR
ncbi:MAG: signal peptidase I [Haloferacaceae archaeon]